MEHFLTYEEINIHFIYANKDFRGFYNQFPKSIKQQRELLVRGGDDAEDDEDDEPPLDEREASLTACNIDLHLKKKNLPGIIPDVDLGSLTSQDAVHQVYREREFPSKL